MYIQSLVTPYTGADQCTGCRGERMTVTRGGQSNPCPTCKGERVIFVKDDSGSRYRVTCPTCHGEGGFGFSSWTYGTCQHCGGTGKEPAKVVTERKFMLRDKVRIKRRDSWLDYNDAHKRALAAEGKVGRICMTYGDSTREFFDFRVEFIDERGGEIADCYDYELELVEAYP